MAFRWDVEHSFFYVPTIATFSRFFQVYTSAFVLGHLLTVIDVGGDWNDRRLDTCWAPWGAAVITSTLRFLKAHPASDLPGLLASMDRPRGTLVQPSLDALNILMLVAPERLPAFPTAWATALPALSDMLHVDAWGCPTADATEYTLDFHGMVDANWIPQDDYDLACSYHVICHGLEKANWTFFPLTRSTKRCQFLRHIVDARPTRLKWMCPIALLCMMPQHHCTILRTTASV
ncbi:hypothetical protein SPRG_07583 [Saprolegnia parasitica CBS 223.65]|uniref:Uncharacterized protein n=1 Tax=Saprolegnia parasitica (strain CBS 223.65) TaxID=695850 RepID=A0A067CLB7_SAPPC|nr:hypothetical protein SPRG_07583 [Saprolegnia parasitica CBS 223.65]KDO27336.1 hypothetical protein SPRG_07583 [Saprolegnia parasitica CBS 223.65]|eukprot:XP_012202107.1 hypothetical protein SPRG_07583 [Saprolegnia parasitica CBS 223.65]